MSFVPILLGLTSALFLSCSDLLSRGASRVQGPYATATHQLLVGTIVLAVVTAVFLPTVTLTPYAVALMVSAAVLNFGSLALLYRGLHEGVVSVVAPIVYSSPSVTLVFSVLLLGVSITATQVVALVGVIAGVLLVSTRFSELRARPTVVGVRYAVVSAILGGLAFLALGAAAPIAGPILPVFFMRAVGALSGFAIAPVLGQKVRLTRYTFSPRVIAVALLAVTAFLAYTTAVNLEPNSLPIVAAVGGIGGAFEAVYAVVYLREKLEPNQIAGVVLLVACVAALLYLSG